MATGPDLPAVEASQQLISPDSGCNIQFSSGTTGQPKAILLSHFNLINNGYHIGQRLGFHLSAGRHRICMQMPFFHVYGTVIAVVTAMHFGETLVLPDAGFNTAKSLEAITAEKCTVLYGTPTMHVDLLARQRSVCADISSLEMATTGGAHCTPELYRRMQTELQVGRVKTIYGLTETTSTTFQSVDGPETDRQFQETVGKLHDHLEAKVVDEQGTAVPFGTRGELCVRGYSTMLGYWGDEEKTRETLGNDGWLRTGDQFVLQEDGYGRIVGRLKEMIIRGGENLFPKEIEDFLTTHPKIQEVHVIGVPDERMGEEVCAYVKLHQAADTLTADELKAFCKGQIAHFKIPRYLKIVDRFPKTQSGKIQKFKMLETWKSEVTG